jgi:hypothetical protein
VYVYANGNFLGGLSVGQSGIVAMTPGTYYVQYKDTYYFSQLLGGYYPVVLGEITTVP